MAFEFKDTFRGSELCEGERHRGKKKSLGFHCFHRRALQVSCGLLHYGYGFYDFHCLIRQTIKDTEKEASKLHFDYTALLKLPF